MEGYIPRKTYPIEYGSEKPSEACQKADNHPMATLKELTGHTKNQAHGKNSARERVFN